MTDSHNDASSVDSSTGSVAARPSRSGIVGGFLRVLLPLCLLCCGYYAFSVLSIEPAEDKTPPPEKKAIRTRITELKRTDYPVVIQTNGIIQPHNEVILSSEVAGQVVHISESFEVGSYFSAGDILVELDARDYKTAVAVAEAQRQVAKSALQLAEENHARVLTLYQKEVVSAGEINQATASMAQAAGQLDTAAAQLEQAQRDLERTVIRAPFDGRVRRKTVGLGQSLGNGTPLGQVFAIDFAEVRLPISGRELAYLDLPEFAGDATVDVELRDSINTGREIAWRAKIVRTEGALDENSLELFAIARVDDPFGRKSGRPPLRIGQPVNASIVGNTLHNVVALPRMAVRQLDQIYLIDNQELTLSSRRVDAVWSDDEHIIIRDPTIRDGQWLSVTHLVYAPDGSKVEIIPDVEFAAVDGKFEGESTASE